MFKRISAFFTILSFIGFSSACVYWPTREIRNEGDYPAPGRKVAQVVKANGEVVDFTGPGLGRVRAASVQGTAFVSFEQTIELRRPVQLARKRADGSIAEITDAKGHIHYVLSVVREGTDSLVIKERHSEMQEVSIPLKDVRLIKYRKGNTVLTVMAIAALTAAGLFVWAVISMANE